MATEDTDPHDNADAELDAAAKDLGLDQQPGGEGGDGPDGEFIPGADARRDDQVSHEAREWAGLYITGCGMAAMLYGDHWKADRALALEIGQAAAETFPDTGFPPWAKLATLLVTDLGMKYAITVALQKQAAAERGEDVDDAPADDAEADG